MTRQVYGVIESTDQLFVNFFTDRSACEEWIQSDRMGDTICGPFIVQTTEDTPFEIVLGCDYSNTIEQIYLEEETFETHNNLFGSYTVYKSITGFEDRVD